jgi:hypothetical protein
MSKRKTRVPVVHDDALPSPELLAADLPHDKPALQAEAERLVDAINAAILAGDLAGAELASAKYSAIVWKQNGGTLSGSYAGPSSPGVKLDAHCAARPGDVPKWGQHGDFLVERQGMRVWVHYEPWSGAIRAHFELNVVDLDRPFLSETGYRSHFQTVKPGDAVKTVAEGIVDAFLMQRRRGVEPAQRDALAARALPAWLTKISPPPRRVPATLPPGFERVDVVLPAHQAFVARRWADQAMFSVAAASSKALAGQQSGAGRPRVSRARKKQKDEM